MEFSVPKGLLGWVLVPNGGRRQIAPPPDKNNHRPLRGKGFEFGFRAKNTGEIAIIGNIGEPCAGVPDEHRTNLAAIETRVSNSDFLLGEFENFANFRQTATFFF